MYVPRSHGDKNDREDSNLLHLFLVVDSVLREQYVCRFRFVLFFVLSDKGACDQSGQFLMMNTMHTLHAGLKQVQFSNSNSYEVGAS